MEERKRVVRAFVEILGPGGQIQTEVLRMKKPPMPHNGTGSFLLQELNGGSLRGAKEEFGAGAGGDPGGVREAGDGAAVAGERGGSHLVGISQAVARAPLPARVLDEDVSLDQLASLAYFDVVRCPWKLSSIGPSPDRVVLTAVV